MTRILQTRWTTLIFLCLAFVLYCYGVVSASYIPHELDSVALPLDFMVGIPTAFWLIVVRPRKLSLLVILPVIWLGYGLSSFALRSTDAGVLPFILAALIPVEAGIAIVEIRKIAKAFKEARTTSDDPVEWLYGATCYLVRKELPARMMAAELSVWYYALFSWRKKPRVSEGVKTFTYHNAGGYMNMMLGLALAFPVEIVGVHLLLSQWSMLAALVVTLLSVYAAAWLIGDARARIMRPIVVGKDALQLECGIQMHADIPYELIETISANMPSEGAASKAEILNYGTFYQVNVWIETKQPVKVRTLLGTKSVRYIGVSIDVANSFINELRMR